MQAPPPAVLRQSRNFPLMNLRKRPPTGRRGAAVGSLAPRADQPARVIPIYPGGRSGYDGAGYSRLIGNWFPGHIDFNSLISTASPQLRARVRDLVRNFPPFARAVNTIVAFTVGKGARFQSLALDARGEPDPKLRRMIEDRFRAWMDEADVAGKLHFYELKQLAKRQECECGEYLAIFTSPRRRDRHALAVQMLEAENLTSLDCHSQAADTEIFNGVEYDIRTGEPVAYHFQTGTGRGQLFETWREPAANVLHGFEVLRPGQLRGVTPFAAAVLIARDLADFVGAEIDAAKMAAKWLAIVKSPDPSMMQMGTGLVGSRGPAQRDDIEDLENAIIEYLNVGEDVSFAPPSGRPGDSFDRAARFCLRMVGITRNIPYEILSGDYTGLNYSTSKAVRNDFSMFLAPEQFRGEQHFDRPIFRRWLAHEALTQDYMRGYFLDPARFERAMWIPAGMPSVDPLRDNKADIDAVRAGLKSPQEVILSRGGDPEEVAEQCKAWADLCASLGLDATTGDVSTSLANNPAKLGAVEELGDEEGGEPAY